jgi:hypothetical protein
MTGSLAKPLAPRPGARRPYPDPLTREELCAVEEAIGVALEAILADRGRARPLDEVTVTHRLRRRLNEMLNDGQPVPGFTCRVFETLVVGNEEENAAGTAQEKRPDLTVRRCGPHPVGVDRGDNALFVECKVIDGTRTMRCYVPDGLARFVAGTYARAVSIGLMVGYVDGAYALPTTLQRYLDRAECGVPARVAPRPGPAMRPVYVTIHPRPWPYPEGGAPGDIRIGHLWITAPT